MSLQIQQVVDPDHPYPPRFTVRRGGTEPLGRIEQIDHTLMFFPWFGTAFSSEDLIEIGRFIEVEWRKLRRAEVEKCP